MNSQIFFLTSKNSVADFINLFVFTNIFITWKLKWPILNFVNLLDKYTKISNCKTLKNENYKTKWMTQDKHWHPYKWLCSFLFLTSKFGKRTERKCLIKIRENSIWHFDEHFKNFNATKELNKWQRYWILFCDKLWISISIFYMPNTNI